MAWAPFIVLYSSSSNLLSGEGQKDGKKKEGKKERKKVEPALNSLVQILTFPLSDTLLATFTYVHFPSSIYLCVTIPWSWRNSSILEITQSYCSGNCRHRLAGKKPGVTEAALWGHQMPEPKVLFTAACLEHFLGCQNKNTVLDHGHTHAISVQVLHIEQSQIMETELGWNLKMLGKPCLFQCLNKSYTHVFLFCNEEMKLQWQVTEQVSKWTHMLIFSTGSCHPRQRETLFTVWR